jgi:deazaflavin-dependent oxidoreductase (nitroreductase family)
VPVAEQAVISSATIPDAAAERAIATAERGRPDSKVMAYLKPPWFVAKVFNKIAMATGLSNSETLTVTKRGSKEPQKIPVITVDVGGTKYLVSTRGESQWVKNVRANPNVTVTSKSGTSGYLARETPERDRQPILTAYREKAGRAVEGYFRQLPRETDHPVFSLTPSS